MAYDVENDMIHCMWGKSERENEDITRILRDRGVNTCSIEHTEDKDIFFSLHGKEADKIFEQYLRDNNLTGILKLLAILKDELIKSSPLSTVANHIIIKEGIGPESDYGLILETGYIDMTLSHAFFQDGKLMFFDLKEYVEQIPLNYILFHAIKSAYYNAKITTQITFDSILDCTNISIHKNVYDQLDQYIGSVFSHHRIDHSCESREENNLKNIHWKIELYRQNMANDEQGNYKNTSCIALLADIESDLDKLNNEQENCLVLMQQQKEQDMFAMQAEKDKEINELNQVILNKLAFADYILNRERLEKHQTYETYQIIDLKDKEIQELQDTILCQKGHIELLLESDRELQDTILCQKGHIGLLLESDRELERIKNGSSWRYVSRLERIERILCPAGSRRRRCFKVVYKIIRFPFRATKKLFSSRRKVKDSSIMLETCAPVSKATINTHVQNTPKAEPKLINQSIKEYVPLHIPVTIECLVSIVIPVYNQFEYTYQCLKSILDNSGSVSYEILIADDCSTDTTTRIKEIVSGLVVINNETNLGFLKNCNHAAQHAKGKYILFLNNDTLVQENWLEPLVSLLESDEKIGLVGSKLMYANGCLQEAGGIFWKDGSAWNYGNQKDPSEPDYNYVKEVDYISGASIMISNELWKKIGGFDESFAPAYYEDSDLAFSVRKLGYKVMYQPLSVVIHLEGVSNGTDISCGQKSYQVINQKKFLAKWKAVLQKNNFENGENVFLVRDRSRHKKHILVVDHYVPHHDKDAGGKCTYMYIKLFLKLGMQVTFLGDNFFPHQPYTQELQQLGVEVIYGNYYCENWKNWLKENGRYFDYAYLNRPHIAVKYIDYLRNYSDCKIIYFGHDLHYLREMRQYEIDNNPETLKSSNEWKMKEFELFQKTDVIWVVGTYEQQILIREFPNKPVMNIPLYIYDEQKKDVNTRFQERNDIIFVGGFGHPPNGDAVLWFAKEIFPGIVERYPDIKWYIVGSKPPKAVMDLQSKNIVVTGFISDEKLDDLYAGCRLAVVPLRVGAGVKGKVIEAAYNRIPLVTTKIGAEGLSLEEKAFVVANVDRSMIKVINDLYSDFNALAELSENSKKFIDRHFTEKKAIEIVSQAVNFSMNVRKTDWNR